MEDLIYNFLLQSNYPRASILLDTDLVESKGTNANASETSPEFIIVDPDTAQPLAVINTFEGVNDAAMRKVAIQTRNYAAKLSGKTVQGFVIRVNLNGASEDEQVQFYRIWPNKSIQQLTPKKFPDLDTLKVARKLADARSTDDSADERDTRDSTRGSRSRKPRAALWSSPLAKVYLPAILLLVLLLLDSIVTVLRGTPLLTLSQSILFTGAAVLFAVPAAIGYFRRS